MTKNKLSKNKMLEFIIFIYAFIMVFILPNLFKIFNNKIIFLNVFFIIVGVILYSKTKYIFFIFLNMIIFIINEILYRFGLIDIYPVEEKTKMFYDLADIWHYKSYFTKHNRGTGNYTDGYYPNEESKIESQEKNDIRKFDNWIKILNIEPGESVLECGCGTGEFLKYLKSKNIKSVGITLSEVTANRLVSENIEAYYHDYRNPNKKLNNRFDHIIFPGSLEHLTTYFINSSEKLYNKQIQNVKKLMNNISPWYKTNSNKKHLFVNCLHVKKQYNNSFPAHLLERSYGGSYFTDEKGKRLQDIIDDTKIFKTKLLVDDRTFDYYYASVKNEKHFGSPGTLNKPEDLLSILALIISPLIYPFFIYLFLYDKLGIWMWQFDGKYHFLDGRCKTCTLTKNRPVNYYYSVHKKI
jgi:cyclopropane fatty-acyl-phospholipid synthase-like methyltransferase